MKSQQIGRMELLDWLNEFIQSDYSKIEQLSDAVGYCQIIDAIHPNKVILSKLNFNAKYKDDFQRNLNILNESFKKIGIRKEVQVEKLSQGKFQENINFLQWLYSYACQIGPIQKNGSYRGYEIRQDALSKQRNKNAVMAVHLVPNNAFMNFQTPYQNFHRKNLFNLTDQNQEYQDSKQNKIEEYIQSLEQDFKYQMEYNWKLMYAIDDMIHQRNTLFEILQHIDQKVLGQADSNGDIFRQINQIIKEVPQDFKIQN